MELPKKILLQTTTSLQLGRIESSSSHFTSNDSQQEWWFFSGLPTKSQLQKYPRNVVKYQPHLRQFLEKGLIMNVIDVERLQRHDYLYHRGSGIDTVIAKLLSLHDVTVLVDVSSFRKENAICQARLLGRVQQNLRLSKKYGFKVAFCSWKCIKS